MACIGVFVLLLFFFVFAFIPAVCHHFAYEISSVKIGVHFGDPSCVLRRHFYLIINLSFDGDCSVLAEQCDGRLVSPVLAYWVDDTLSPGNRVAVELNRNDRYFRSKSTRIFILQMNESTRNAFISSPHPSRKNQSEPKQVAYFYLFSCARNFIIFLLVLQSRNSYFPSRRFHGTLHSDSLGLRHRIDKSVFVNSINTESE